ncbi:hypothetical protein CHS0354_038484, partial [Potamilus streckersoni]
DRGSTHTRDVGIVGPIYKEKDDSEQARNREFLFLEDCCESMLYEEGQRQYFNVPLGGETMMDGICPPARVVNK